MNKLLKINQNNYKCGTSLSGVKLYMKKSMRVLFISICCFVGIIMFTDLLSNLNMRGSLASDDLNIPIYIIDSDNLTEIKVDTSYIDNYNVEKITMENLSTNNSVKISPINDSFFIYDSMNRGDEYSLNIFLRNGDTQDTIDKVVRFNYIDSKFSFKNISQNYFDVSFRYTRKNVIFIDSVEIYGRDSQNNSDKVDFHLKRSIGDISIFKKSLLFNNIGIMPSTTYNVDCVVNMKNNVHLVSRNVIRSKDFSITDLKCNIIGENLIELKWDTSSDIKFLENDSIKIFVKTKNDINYPDIPSIKILDEKVKKSIVKLDKPSSEYEIKLCYDLSGKEISTTVKQINNFYDLNTDIDIVNIRNLILQYSFKNNMKFNIEGKLNIYLLNESTNEDPILISSKALNTEVNKVNYNGLKCNSSYKLIYKILYDKDNSIVIKEESFITQPFSIKDISITQDITNEEHDVNVSWSLKPSSFIFSEKDSLNIYLKNKDDRSYGDDPIFYKNGDLGSINSCDIKVPNDLMSGDPHYDLKIVYNIDGVDYVSYGNFILRSDRSTYQGGESESSDESLDNDYQDIVDEIFFITVKDQRVNEVVFNIHFPKSFHFTEGDNIKIFKKPKGTQKDKDKVPPDYELIHLKEGEDQLDFSKLNEIRADYLEPNKEYEFEFVISTKNYLPSGEGVPLPIFPHQDSVKKEMKEEEVEEESNGASSGSNGENDETAEEFELYEFSKKLSGKTEELSIKTFTTSSIGPNNASFTWELSKTGITFNEKDMVEIYIKRKIVGGYPPKAAFKKVGNEINNLSSGVGTVANMNMDYTAKLVYTVSGVKLEKTVDFRTISSKPFCLIQDVTEHSAKLQMVHPEGYIFVEGDAIEIYTKQENDVAYPKFPIARIEHIDGSQSLNDLTSFNLTNLNPDVLYEVMVKYLNKANDIPDAKVQFKTKPLVIDNCRIDSMSGNNLRIMADLVNDIEVLDYIELYVDVFYKPTNKDTYYKQSLITTWGREALDFQIKLPDVYTDYDILVSYSPHGYFNETYFIEFELPYRCIQGSVEVGEKQEDGVNYRTYNAIWNYGDVTDLKVNDKLSVYLREVSKIPEGDSDNTKNISTKSQDYIKLYTFDSNIRENTFFNLDQYLNENTSYEILLNVEADRFVIGPGKVNFNVDILRENQSSQEDIFDNPVSIVDFSGEGDSITFSLPDMGDIILDSDTPIGCDIENVTVNLTDDGNLNIKGLVPGKDYPKIDVIIYVQEDRSIILSLENVNLEAVDPVQTFLYNVYKRAFLRDPDEGGYHYWIGELKSHRISSRDFLLNLLFAEKEFSELKYSTDKFIEILYSIVVDRDPDHEGLMYWINLYNNEALVNASGDTFIAKRFIVDRMVNEAEFKNMVEGMGLKY